MELHTVNSFMSGFFDEHNVGEINRPMNGIILISFFWLLLIVKIFHIVTFECLFCELLLSLPIHPSVRSSYYIDLQNLLIIILTIIDKQMCSLQFVLHFVF